MRLQGRCGQDSHFQRQLMALRKQNQVKQARSKKYSLFWKSWVSLKKNVRLPAAVKGRPHHKNKKEKKKEEEEKETQNHDHLNA